MLVVATVVFLYYTTWTLLMVRPHGLVVTYTRMLTLSEPFVDAGHPLHDFFPPRVWAIRIPVILILVGGAVVGSFLGVVMIRSKQKKAAKTRTAVSKKKA